MAKLVLRAMKAKHGDALLMFANGTKILIDGGPSGVYSQTLRDHLLDLERDGDDPPRIDLLMVSHIDADHIDGVLDLTAELIDARDAQSKPIVQIDRAWHNSFSDMIAKSGTVTSSAVKAAAAGVASVFEDLSGPGFAPQDSKLVLSSVAQGRQLRLDLEALHIDLNKRFKHELVLQENANGAWTRGELKLMVIGPTQAELDRLRETWAKKLETILRADGAASTAAASELDDSISNLASIVVIAEVGKKSALLTGDARGDLILKWLEDAGRLKPGKSVHFDIVKLPHHGSDRNVTPKFFERITADHYVICGNGGHGNPEPDTLEMLFHARPNLDFKIHMTYGPEELKSHKKFKKEGNVAKLDAVLSDPDRRAILRFPEPGETHIDVEP